MSPELSQNLQVLANRFPEVIDALKAQIHQHPSPAELQDYLALIYADPQGCERWAASVAGVARRVYVTSGFGDGTHLHRLLGQMAPSSRVCVLEADVGMLLGLLQQRDVSDLLNHPRFILLTPFSYREGIQRLNLELIGIQSARKLPFAPIYDRQSALYQNLMEAIMRQLTIRCNQLKTNVTNAERVFSNTLQNLSQHQFGSEITAMRGLFKDRPLVLVGAGPSLDESFDFLRAARGRAAIAVVNSAYRAVVNQGIQPDLTVAVDPNEGTFRGYEGSDTHHPILFSTYLVYPKVPALFPGRVVPLSSYNLLMTLVRRVLKLPEEPAIVGEGTVSCTVVNLAAYLGCNEIYLVGQDMAVRSDGQSHVTDSFYTDAANDHLDPATCEWLPGNEGSLVPVAAKLRAYLRIFENLVSHYTDIRFHNLARTGARIHGAPYLDLERAVEQIQHMPSLPFHALLTERMERSRLPSPLFEGVKRLFTKYDQFLDTFLTLVLSFAVEGELWVLQNDRARPTDSLLAKRQQVLELMQRHPLYVTLLGEGRTKREYHDFICAEEPWSLITDPDASIPELLPQVWAFVEGAVFQREQIQTYLLMPESVPK